MLKETYMCIERDLYVSKETHVGDVRPCHDVSKETCVCYKSDMYFKRDLCMNKRDLCTYKRDMHVKRDVYMTCHVHRDLSKETCSRTKETSVCTHEAYVCPKKPICAKETYIRTRIVHV